MRGQEQKVTHSWRGGGGSRVSRDCLGLGNKLGGGGSGSETPCPKGAASSQASVKGWRGRQESLVNGANYAIDWEAIWVT